MWRKIYDHNGVERKPASEKWKKINENFLRSMMSAAEPLVVMQSIKRRVIKKSPTAVASKAPKPLSIAPSAPEVKTIDLSEEEGASGAASYTPPKIEGPSEPEKGEKGNEGKSIPYAKGHPSQLEDIEEENSSEDSLTSLTISEISSLADLFEEENGTWNEYDQGDEKQQQKPIEGAVGGIARQDNLKEEEEKNVSGQAEDVANLSENNGAHGGTTRKGFPVEQFCEIFNDLIKILPAQDTQTLDLIEREPTNIMKSKKPRKKNKKRHQ